MRFSFILLLFCSLLNAPVFGQGDTLSRSFIHEDSLRSYLLYVPAAYDGTENWPLVINYHGFNNMAANQMFISQMNPVADTANFLVAYPQGLLINNPFLGFAAPGWNISGVLSENDDIDFTSQLIDQISAGYAVDPARVYATGWSMGAGISFQVSCRLPDRIASVAGVANQMADSQIESCTPGRPLSALLMHGTADPIAPFNGSGDLFSSAYNTPSFWAGQNNCSPDSLVTDFDDIVTTDTSTVTLIEYTDCDADTEVLFYRINGGGHAWPGGGALPAFLGKVNRDINASSEIWNFFNRNPLDKSVSTEPGLEVSTFDFSVYPNPFSEELTVEFELSSIQSVQLRLLNALGQPVGKTIDRRLPAGRQRLQWRLNNGSFPAGTYYLQLIVEGKQGIQSILYKPNY